ncbi:MAG: serine/threonine protein kinase, partial [Acidimicrobiales bacterium]|nr:serine/threonine protein kinase [Acidimicrobiales bacterium]
TAPPGPRDVRNEPAGLFCRDLQRLGYSYSAAVDYWRMHGQTNQMDIDHNGIPCETVFSRADVAAYWGLQPVQPTYGGLRSGLSCKDLANAGFSYSQAVGYWYSQGTPDRMDIDHNGIPCETVYSASVVGAYWGF